MVGVKSFMKEFWEKERNEILFGVGVFVLCLFLRLYNLTLIPVFGDEAIYIRWAQVMRAEPTLRFLPLTDGKQPLFMWAVIPFLKLFYDPLVAGRIVSVFSGLGTLAGIFVLTWLFFKSRKIAWLASLIYAISPFSIFFDRLALVDSMLSMFGVWTLIFATITVKRVRLDSAMLSGFALGGALLTKTPATFFAALIPFTLILHHYPKSLKDKFNRISVFVFLFTFTYVIAYGIYNILRLGPNFHMIAIRNKDYVYPLTHIFEKPLDPFYPFLDRIKEYFWLMGPGFFVFMLFLGIFQGIKKFPKETLVLFSWGVLPILLMAEFSKVMTARYIFFTLPYLFILSALSLDFLIKKKREEVKLKYPIARIGLNIRILAVLMLIFFAAHSFFINFQLLTNPQSARLPRSERSGYLEEWTSGYGIREVSEYLKRRYSQNKDKRIVVGTEGYFGTLPDGLQMYLNETLEITVIGVGLPIKDVPKQLKDSFADGNETYLVVNSSRFLGNPELLGLKLISAFPKAIRPDGTRELLLFFEVTSDAFYSKIFQSIS